MVTISLCMIVRNEEGVLARCLDSIQHCVEEIVIVDTGSTDRTREIAGRYAQKVLSFAWGNDFSAARNFAYDQATMDYQLWLDADDVLPPEEGAKLLALKETLSPQVDMVTMKYHTHFDPNGLPLLTVTRERLTRREKGCRWQDPVHEFIPLGGNLFHSDIAICHRKPKNEAQGHSTRNLEIYRSLESSGVPLSPRQTYYFARELKDHDHWGEAAACFRRFLDAGAGWWEDKIAACYNLGLCHKALGQEDLVLPSLLRSFAYGPPRAELCCEIGYWYQRRLQYRTALGWFRTAAALPPPDALSFVLPDCWGYIPHIESCVCCCHLGEYEKAREYNALAEALKPGDPVALYNRQYLQGKEQAPAGGV